MRPPTMQRRAARLPEWPCSRCRSGTPQTCTPPAQRRKSAPRSRARQPPAAAAVLPRSLPTAPPAAHPKSYTVSGDPPLCAAICCMSHWSLLYILVSRDEVRTVRDDIIELQRTLQDECYILLLTLLEWSCKSLASASDWALEERTHSHYSTTQIGERFSSMQPEGV